MKNLFIGLIATGFITLSSFTSVTESKEKVVVKPKIYNVYCNGVYSGFFACDGCNVQAVANAICNG